MLRKRWHRIPVALVSIILLLALTAGGALAAFTFTGMKVDVAVDEPLQVQYNLFWYVHDTENPGGRWEESGWLNAEGLQAPIPAQFSAGDEMILRLRMNNRANSTLTVSTLVSGDTGMFTYSGFPQNQEIPISNGYDFGSGSVDDAEAADWTGGDIPIKVKGDAPAPKTYGLTFEFTRE